MFPCCLWRKLPDSSVGSRVLAQCQARYPSRNTAFSSAASSIPPRSPARSTIAARWGVHPHDVLIANGWLDAEDYYRALAEACGDALQGSFCTSDVAPAARASPRQSLASGLLKERARRAGFVLAPDRLRPNALREMLARLKPYALSLASPHALRGAICRHFAETFASGAVEGLATRHPDKSARPRTALWQRLTLALGALSLLSAVAVAPGDTRHSSTSSSSSRRLTPTTIAAARALRLPGNVEIVVVPELHPRTKPKALNYALPLARGEYLVIYDAEDRPERDQLRLAFHAFSSGAPNLATVQAKLNLYNASDNWLTRQFTIEYCALFDGLLPALDRPRLPIPLGGTSNHFRVSALKWLMAWDPFNVTEDADLGMRLARSGYRCAMLSLHHL